MRRLEIGVTVLAPKRQGPDVIQVEVHNVNVATADTTQSVVHLKDNESVDTYCWNAPLPRTPSTLSLALQLACSLRISFSPAVSMKGVQIRMGDIECARHLTQSLGVLGVMLAFRGSALVAVLLPVALLRGEFLLADRNRLAGVAVPTSLAVPFVLPAAEAWLAARLKLDGSEHCAPVAQLLASTGTFI
jgi:hypothetical protein